MEKLKGKFPCDIEPSKVKDTSFSLLFDCRFKLHSISNYGTSFTIAIFYCELKFIGQNVYSMKISPSTIYEVFKGNICYRS